MNILEAKNEIINTVHAYLRIINIESSDYFMTRISKEFQELKNMIDDELKIEEEELTSLFRHGI